VEWTISASRPRVLRHICEILGTPPGYFAEERELSAIEWIQSDPELRDRLYAQLRRKRKR
jgi:hypothetical protein